MDDADLCEALRLSGSAIVAGLLKEAHLSVAARMAVLNRLQHTCPGRPPPSSTVQQTGSASAPRAGELSPARAASLSPAASPPPAPSPSGCSCSATQLCSGLRHAPYHPGANCSVYWYPMPREGVYLTPCLVPKCGVTRWGALLGLVLQGRLGMGASFSALKSGGYDTSRILFSAAPG